MMVMKANGEDVADYGDDVHDDRDDGGDDDSDDDDDYSGLHFSAAAHLLLHSSREVLCLRNESYELSMPNVSSMVQSRVQHFPRLTTDSKFLYSIKPHASQSVCSATLH